MGSYALYLTLPTPHTYTGGQVPVTHAVGGHEGQLPVHATLRSVQAQGHLDREAAGVHEFHVREQDAGRAEVGFDLRVMCST